MSAIEMTAAKADVVNGVNVTALGETLAAVGAAPALGQFRFHARNRWLGGALNRTTIKTFHGAGQEQRGAGAGFTYDADEPQVLLGEDGAANPVEYLLHALAGCMTTTMVYHAASRGIVIEALESALEGDLDIRGFTGLSDDVPKGYQAVRAAFRVKTRGDLAMLADLCRMSPVYNSLIGSVPIEIAVEPM